MSRLLIIALLLTSYNVAGAQVFTLGDVKTKSGVQLNASELTQLMGDATVASKTDAGSTRS